MITLATLATATKQEVFDQVKNHLLSQKKKAVSEYGSCYYRVLKDGKILKCAGGCLIADDEYNPHMEGRLWGTLPDITDYHAEFISELQQIHDKNDPDKWEGLLKIAATKHELAF